MYIKRKRDNMVFKVFGTATGQTRFLIWENNEWRWELATDFVPSGGETVSYHETL